MTTKEQEIQKHMRVLKITRTEAEQLWLEDNSDEVLPEVAEMEKKAKEMKRRYEGDTKKRKSANKPRKPDEVKESLIVYLFQCLFQNTDFGLSKVTVTNPTKEISFSIGEVNYSVTLTRHTKKKK